MPIPDFQSLMLPLLQHRADGANHSKRDAVPCLLQFFHGPMLADLMIDFGLGISPVNSYEIKRIDSDYFDED